LARRLIMAMCPPSGIVLDPFVGSGTTLAAALGVGRNAIGIDLDERNAELAAEQVGMFLHVDHHQPGRLSLPKGTS
jgi:DNA modification methylase